MRNQVLVAFGDGGHPDAVHAADAAVQHEGPAGSAWTTWRGRRLMRISVSNWSTTEADANRSVDGILRLADETAGTWAAGRGRT